jgi:hypothetical protein
MATRKVRLHFTPLSTVAPAWDVAHDVPADLITSFQEEKSASYQLRFGETMTKVCTQYQDAMNTRCGPTCGVCDLAPTTYGKSFCISQLAAPEPYVLMGIVPTCGTPECREGASSLVQMFREEYRQHDSQSACKVCGKLDGTMRCAKCKEVRYCSVEHQKEDWKKHKKVCWTLAADEKRG